MADEVSPETQEITTRITVALMMRSNQRPSCRILDFGLDQLLTPAEFHKETNKTEREVVPTNRRCEEELFLRLGKKIFNTMYEICKILIETRGLIADTHTRALLPAVSDDRCTSKFGQTIPAQEE